MTRRVSCILLSIMLILLIPFNCLATENDEVGNVIYFDDGSYMVEQIFVIQSRASGTVTGDKIDTYYSSNGTALWKAVLTGSFTYSGTSSTCTSSSVSVTIYDNDWYTISKSASKSGNAATSSVTMGCKMLGVTVNKEYSNLTLTCDKDGNLS